MTDVKASTVVAGEPGGRRRRWAYLALVLIVLALLSQASLWRPGTRFGLNENVQIAEAQAWWSGRLDLPERRWDTALYHGKVYSYFPPAFTFISALIVPIADGVPQIVLVGLAALAVVLIYRLFVSLVAPFWAAVLTLGFVLGTSAWPVFQEVVRSAAPYHVNHMLAVIGCAVLLHEWFGRRRLWPMLVGWALAVWSRQMMVVFAIPLLWSAWCGRGDRQAPNGVDRKRLAVCLVWMAAVGGVYLALNTAKFGNPFRTGYMLNHQARSDVFARESRAHGLLSPHWMPRNLYYINLGFPRLNRIEVDGGTRYYLRPNEMGTGIWWTTPLLVWLLVDLRRIWRDPTRRVWLVSVALLVAMLSLWHATGAVQRGYNRYSLDFMLVLWALIVPGCVAPKRRWVSVALLAWGVLYFRVVLTWPHVRVW